MIETSKSSQRIVKSMKLRITLLFSLITAFILLATFGYLYYFLHNYFKNEAAVILDERVMLISDIMIYNHDGLNSLKNRIEKEWVNQNYEPLWIQVVLPDGKVFAESPQYSLVTGSDYFKTQHRIKIHSNPISYIDVSLILDRSKEADLLVSYGKKLFFLFCLTILFTGYLTSKVISLEIFPLLKMSRKMRNISLKSLNRRINPDNFSMELVPVAESFNIMLNELEKSFDKISRFSGDIAHELRTPLNALMIKLEVMLEKPRSNEEYVELFESLQNDARGLSKLIDTLLFLSRTEKTTHSLQLEIISLKDKLEGLVEFYEPLASEKQMAIELKMDSNIQIAVEKNLFDRAIGNLLQNAIQHCPPGTHIDVKAHSDNTQAIIEVSDNGQGIEAYHLPLLFDRLYRVDNSRSAESGGLGLGLAIVASIMKLHGGNVSVESNISKGSTFRLSFPISKKTLPTKLFE